MTACAWLTIAAAACGPRAPAALPHDVGAPVADAGAAAEAWPPEKRHCDLDYVVNGHPFASPVVRATVGGVETTMLIDTGANTHILAGWLARKAHLELRALDDRAPTRRARRAEHPELALDGWGPIPDRPMLVVEVPEKLEELGIGGFVSPQQLATRDRLVVLDLERAEMRTAEPHEVEALPGRLLGRGPARVCSDEDFQLGRTLAFVVKATLEAHDVELLVDTGAATTDLLIDSSVGKALALKTVEKKEGTAGKARARVLVGGKLALGEVEATVDVNVLAGGKDAFCPHDGVVAMDVLRRCTLVFAPASMTGTCKAK